MMAPKFKLSFLSVKYWPTWFGLFILRLLSFLPYSWMKKLSRFLGRIFFPLAKQRKHIIETNIKLCFADKTEKEQIQLSRAAFISTIMAVFEIAITWWGTKSKIQRLHQVEGLEYLEQAKNKGKGVILLVSHFTTMEIAGAFLNSQIDNLNVVYKRSNNLVLEYMLQRKRLKYCAQLIKHKNLREIIRSVKQKNVLWYAPDQDFGEKDSIFAPFMGVMTSTLLSTARLAKLTGAPVVPFYVARNENSNNYTVKFSPELENFPSENELADASAINRAIEQQIKQTPEQYLWAHRRFKSRPAGEKDVYST